MFLRVATSDQFEGNPTRVRVEWAFSDFLGAMVWLDGHARMVEEARARAEGAARG